MMPDISQHGSGESQEWEPVENTPVILFDRVSKSYGKINAMGCLLYTSPSPRDLAVSRMPSSA